MMGLSVFKDNVTSIINYKVISLFLNYKVITYFGVLKSRKLLTNELNLR